MPIPASILERVETFRRNLESYLSPDYKETQLRREFLDPLFEALGWDVSNRAGHAEAYKDVVHEDTLRASGVAASAPDYSFRIGGTRKFFVEAKKPAVKIKDAPGPAAQLRRYSYSAKLPLGIVTDFQEFAVYDTRQRPRENDKASAGRVFYCTFEQFAEKWDEITGIFSKDAILRGSFDKFAAGSKGKRGTSEFDDDFLADMEAWRDLLARNLALRNTLGQRDLNFAVQRILDRLIFLRIAEDRGIEPYGQLSALTAGPKIYPRFCAICERADFRYNSGLFHFAAESGRDEAPDKLTLRLAVDDAILKEIISSLYWPKSPYAFAVIPADILGHIYEQFLGKVIHLTSDHRASVEEKPEVRKAGGVYYTPTYIVDYIVRQTVGPLLEGRTPRQVEKLKILDPACGSGSFLLGAFEFLLAWHLDYYLKHDPAAWAKKKNPPLYETAPNAFGVGQGSRNYLLTTAERKRILVANLFGVDIDAQAVEVTKLSLLLKVLEGEARELQGKQLDFHRVLPDLGQNIKCGNSLIGSDFYAQPDLPAFDEEARYKINAFDWPVEFKPVMDAGGFDAVIGNPPYGADATAAEKRYFQTRFVCKEGKPETYVYFVEQGLSLVRTGGLAGMITPNAWLTNYYGAQLRRHVLAHAHIIEIADMEKTRVFTGAVVDTTIAIFEIGKPSTKPTRVMKGGADRSISFFTEVNPSAWARSPDSTINLMADARSLALLEKIESSERKLDSVCDYSQGVIPYLTAEEGEKSAYTSREQKRGWVPLLENASQVARYRTSQPGAFIHYGPWLARPRERRFFSSPKILFHRLRKKLPTQLVGSLDESGVINRHSLSILILKQGLKPEALFAVLAVFNSKLANWWFVKRFGLLMEVGGFKVGQIPLPASWDSSLSRLVDPAKRMLKLHADLAAAQSPDAQTRLQRDIAATDRAIDQLVYQLYDLTPGEIALVEQATAPANRTEAATDEIAPSSPPPEAYAPAEAAAAHHYFAKEPPPPPP